MPYPLLQYANAYGFSIHQWPYKLLHNVMTQPKENDFRNHVKEITTPWHRVQARRRLRGENLTPNKR